MTAKPKRRRRTSGSLLSPQATGGIVAGIGFDFQARYAACHLPIWITQDGFHQLLFEGTGDVDLRFSRDGRSTRVHIQVKDHEVSPAEMLEVVGHFQEIDSGLPGVYERFTIACPSLAPSLRRVEAALARVRGAQPFYDDVPHALRGTKDEVTERLRSVGLAEHAGLILAKVSVEVGHGDLRYDDRAAELFSTRLLAHPAFKAKLLAMVQPAFAEVMRLITARRGVTLDLPEIEGMLQSAVVSGTGEPRGIAVWIHNWTTEVFDRPADYVLDWSQHFDRATRRVPSSDAWRGVLLPELRALRETIATNRTERLIRFCGKCCLSTGLALGAEFAAVGGWVFRIPQPPSPDDWKSDALASANYPLQEEILEGDLSGRELVVGLNIKGDGRQDVMSYIAGTGIRPRAFAFLSPPIQGGQAIAGPADACAFAAGVRDRLGALIKTYRITRTHLFYYGPFALAVFLGQHLTSVGEVQLYEFQDPGYISSCNLRT